MELPHRLNDGVEYDILDWFSSLCVCHEYLTVVGLVRPLLAGYFLSKETGTSFGPWRAGFRLDSS